MEKIKVISATVARAKFFGLIDQTAESHEPVLITTKRNNVVMLGEDDWNSIQETMYLLAIPGMRESIRNGITASSNEMLSKEAFLKAIEEGD